MASTSDEETPRKRQRLEAASDSCISSSRTLTFYDINRDCMLLILSFLSNDDMDSFSVCSRDCYEVRSDESLNQTRTGTILWRETTTANALYDTIARRGWRSVFRGNRTRLRVEGIEKLRLPLDFFTTDDERAAKLPGVTCLDLSCDPSDERMREKTLYVIRLILILPNLQNMDLSYVTVSPIGMMISNTCPNLTRLTWKGCNGSLVLTGEALKLPNLTELYLDDSRFSLFTVPLESREARDFEDEPTNGSTTNFFMWMYCSGLERLSMRNAKWDAIPRNEVPLPITQEMLIKFVRNTPTLRWLRSDLAEDSIAILKRERPEVTFVSD